MKNQVIETIGDPIPFNQTSNALQHAFSVSHRDEGMISKFRFLHVNGFQIRTRDFVLLLPTLSEAFRTVNIVPHPLLASQFLV